MAKRSHHIACVTDDPDAVIGFLTDVIGLELTGRLHAPGDATSTILGWPENDGAQGWMLGQGPGGLVEVIEIPEALRDRVQPGFALASFSIPDLEDRVEQRPRARRRGERPHPHEERGPRPQRLRRPRRRPLLRAPPLRGALRHLSPGHPDTRSFWRQ